LIVARLNAHTRGGVAPIGVDARLSEGANLKHVDSSGGQILDASGPPCLEQRFDSPRFRQHPVGALRAMAQFVVNGFAVERGEVYQQLPGLALTDFENPGLRTRLCCAWRADRFESARHKGGQVAVACGLDVYTLLWWPSLDLQAEILDDGEHVVDILDQRVLASTD